MKKLAGSVLLIMILTLTSCTNAEDENAEQADVTLQAEASATPTKSIPSLIVDATPVPSSNESITMESFQKEMTDSGFQIKALDEDSMYIQEPFITTTADGASYSVHIVRKIKTDADETIMSREAVVVNPDNGEFHVYPLYETLMDDAYNPDSVAKAYGFLDDRHLLFVSVINDRKAAKDYAYRVEKLDILTGEKKRIVPLNDVMPKDDHFANGWLTEDKTTLMLNGYTTGQVWSIQLEKKTINRSPVQVKHDWPFFMTSVSPDGRLYWYADSENRLYKLLNLEGDVIAQIPFGSQDVAYPFFQWSTSGNFAVFYETAKDRSDNVIHDEGEFTVRAMDKATFFDRNGNGKRFAFDMEAGHYFEVSGWLEGEGDLALLKFYQLKGAINERRLENVRYRILNVITGEMIALNQASGIENLTQPVRVVAYQSSVDVEKPVLAVDPKQKLVVALEDSGRWVHGVSAESNRLDWIGYGKSDGKATFKV
ncbi:hypothetical protein RB620_28555 [Paenibacillus sp. LHD-117]|uniref:hypothetical protein n=1 Tax=Paenibacillus sp. LHD-117 TaxID=3071412 RepID=UPI0027E1B265|nr:hypothetical protein [Paenibacillus sp. LHD-117]MDQ6423387.1 hypothetical protein [Paenibacillus sp. LHD-117]